MRVEVDFDVSSTNKRISGRIDKTQAFLDLLIMKDSNKYVPQDVGSLQDSVILYSNLGSGLLIWNTEYAKKQYYKFPNKSKDKNPNASMMWFEKAKLSRKKAWLKFAQERYNNG